MKDIILIVLIVAAAAAAVVFTVRRFKKGSACCGEREKSTKRVKPSDTNKANYPYTVTLKIMGMTCENCARRVENAYNSTPGLWAKVDLGSSRATVRMKEQHDERELCRIAAKAGYTASLSSRTG